MDKILPENLRLQFCEDITVENLSSDYLRGVDISFSILDPHTAALVNAVMDKHIGDEDIVTWLTNVLDELVTDIIGDAIENKDYDLGAVAAKHLANRLNQMM